MPSCRHATSPSLTPLSTLLSAITGIIVAGSWEAIWLADVKKGMFSAGSWCEMVIWEILCLGLRSSDWWAVCLWLYLCFGDYIISTAPPPFPTPLRPGGNIYMESSQVPFIQLEGCFSHNQDRIQVSFFTRHTLSAYLFRPLSYGGIEPWQLKREGDLLCFVYNLFW